MRIFHAASLTAILLCTLKLVASMDSVPDVDDENSLDHHDFTAIWRSIAANTLKWDPADYQEAFDEQIAELMATLKTSKYDPDATVETSKSSSPTVATSPSSSTVEMEHKNPHDYKCTICKVQIKPGDEIYDLPCGHPPHKTCGDHRFIVTPTCPSCKVGIDGTAREDQVHKLPFKLALKE